MRMGFLAKILPPPENKFYNFFENGAEVCELSSQLFYQIVHSDLKEREVYLIHAKTYKRRAVEALEGSLALLNASFVTPIDREDIQLISTYLYKSTKVVLDQSYQDLTIEGEEESDMGAILAVVGVLVIILLIVAAVVVMRRRK